MQGPYVQKDDGEARQAIDSGYPDNKLLFHFILDIYGSNVVYQPISVQILPCSPTQLGATHFVTILVRHRGHSWLVAIINSEQSAIR